MTHEVEEAFSAHAKSIDTLHDALKAHVKPGKESVLEQHIADLKAAHAKVHDGGQDFMI
jgi:hypothetical protein